MTTITTSALVAAVADLPHTPILRVLTDPAAAAAAKMMWQTPQSDALRERLRLELHGAGLLPEGGTGVPGGDDYHSDRERLEGGAARAGNELRLTRPLLVARVHIDAMAR